MKLRLLATCAALFLASAAQAETLVFPSDVPVATISFPDDWSAEETESGIQSFSPDEAISLYVDVATPEDSKTIVDNAIKFLTDNGVTIDAASLKESKDTFNGMEMSNLSYDGTDASGPVSIGLSFVQPSEEKLLVLTYWGTKGEQEKHAEALTSIINSLKPAS